MRSLLAGDGLELHAFGMTQRGLLQGVVSVAGGAAHALAIMKDGTVQAWVR
jgi:alpha-tubulin suppressor-like RCC1 family protein